MNKKITIGLFIDTYFPMVDGVTMVVDNYARRLVNYANVIVFAPTMYKKSFDDSVLPYKVVRCKSMGVPFLDYSLPIPMLDRKFMKQLKEYKLDIVHIHSPATLGKLGIRYAKKLKVPVIATMHSQYKRDIKRAVKLEPIAKLLNHLLIKSTFDKCDECWAVNSEVAKIFYEEYKCKIKPKVMNNATEMMPVKSIEEAKKEIRKKYNIKEDEKIFLFVGRLNALKNIFLIVDSLNLVKEKAPKLKFKMLFVGTGQDEEELVKRIKQNNMANEIVLCGKITDRENLANHYAAADLFLFPSLYDASSIVQIEAASQKTPGLFVEGAATTATITNNINGYITKNDAEQYAEKIIEIFENEEELRKISENAFKDLYVNWDSKIKEVYGVYLNIIKRFGITN